MILVLNITYLSGNKCDIVIVDFGGGIRVSYSLMVQTKEVCNPNEVPISIS